MSCIFCEITSGRAGVPLLYNDAEIAAFKDINPAAPVHILVVPKVHRACFHETEPELLQKMMQAAQEIIQSQGLAEKGYRLIINTGGHGGQTVPHVHLHILGGAPLKLHLN